MNYIVKKTKMQAIEKIVPKHISNHVIVSKTYKELIQFNQEINDSINKQSVDTLQKIDM